MEIWPKKINHIMLFLKAVVYDHEMHFLYVALDKSVCQINVM
uniref:Sema domain-containing protein n=2 Tax=Anguilla anguilla TaxID=7936 RepID=A0A0E9UFB6_ANGAN